MHANNDLHNSIKQVVSILPTTLGATGVISGAIHDRQGYGGVEFLPMYGAVTTTGTVVTVIVKAGDTTGALTSVADSELIGTEALASLLAGARVAGTGKEVAKRIGYIGPQRYVQISLNGTGTTSAGIVAATAILFNPSIVPVANP